MKSPEFEELTEREKELIEDMFPRYLFYRTLPNGDREFHCSHCRQKFTISHLMRTVTPEEEELVRARHGDGAQCPVCGFHAEVKSIGKSKQRKNLWHREKAVVIHAVNHDRVEARCYFAEKDYEYGLTPKTELIEKSRYLLTPGNAVKFKARYYNSEYYSVKAIGEPFPSTAMFYGSDEGYTVFGLNRLENTFLKYNQLDSFISYDAQHYSGCIYNGPIMTYLSYFAIYPQLEMLQKLGHYDVVRALVKQNKKSFPYVNWEAKGITDFFKISKQEYKTFKENGGTFALLRMAYSIRGGKERLDFIKAKKYLDCFGDEYNIKRFADRAEKAGILLDEAFKYVLKKEADYTEYMDYLRMAGALGYDFKVHNVAFPKNLKEAHDNAAAAERIMIEEKKYASLKKKEADAENILKKYEKQYSFTDGKYIITVPHTIKEIVEEGKAMSHCVGGYAGRHMEGVLSILFLRLAAKPDKSLYTIEMHDKILNQVQGFGNRTPLTPEAKAFFDMWLAWVKGGSKRTKSGEPIIRAKAAAKTA